jgi:hypothetical protein
LKSFLIGLLGLALVGCSAVVVETNAKPYIGRPVSDVALRLGPPTTVSHGPNGWPIFRWSNFGPSGQTIGKVTAIEGLVIHQGRCSLLVQSQPAKPNPSPAMTDWIIEDWRFVGMGCV